MAIQFLLLSFLVLLFNNGASSYISSEDLSNSLAEAPSYNNHPNSDEQNVFNVDDYGAKANGSDDSEAFKEAWEAACNSNSNATVLLIPRNKTYILRPLIFRGPCEPTSVTVKIKGNLKAPSDRSDWSNYWIKFRNVTRLTVRGGGQIDGSGQIWWQHSCKINRTLPCRDAPTALYFYHCRHLKVRNITSKDSQQMHIVFSHCHNVEAVHLTIRAPDWSPNTDGIHLSSTRNMRISNCFIGTGDDCISIVNGSRNVHVDNIVCGPGHGISIGSLGSNNSRAHVSKVHVEKATLIGTDNGVRIKTWQGGRGHAKNIHFEDISMCNVYNPIIINQNYCDSKIPCYQQDSAVAVREVVYKNIRGTSASDISINFNCSSTVPCKYIKLQDISLVSPDSFTSRSSCINVINSTESGSVFPSCNAQRN
ncbi:Pectin lyase-like superfamily protein [Rhynchospora pubera]|uniref:endo-polygalacturonase n=1 Tax=Rhynchospora pubera TaxID=906938 RepID=A0AAV8HRF8_9POAL|nr:Pectin lyase-like superfamily protein [Rhynchospora pubera]